VKRAGARAALTLASAGLLLGLAVVFDAPLDAAPAKKKKKKAESTKEAPVNFDKNLPVLGTKMALLPPGPGKDLADGACLTCHAADVVAQQHLTEKQWAAEIVKMAGWGAPVPEKDREALAAYLAANFGPGNLRWQPVVTRPVGR
jgi:mono/diheme cytochrome c family protein